MKQAAFFCNAAENVDMVYRSGRRRRVAEVTDLYPHVVTDQNLAEHAPHLRDLEVVFSTWGMLQLDQAALEQFPRWQILMYGAGSIQGFARPLFERGIRIVTARHMIGEHVAAFTLGQILLANKGFFRNMRDCRTPQGRVGAFRGRGNFDATVALLGGDGSVGRSLIERLKPFRFKVIVYDPFLDQRQAEQLGVGKVSLEEAFREGDVVSNHLADKPQTKKLINGGLFALMRDDATFINTGRGATVNEADLAREFARRPTLTALLDVTRPEPPEPDSPLYRLANVILTSHIAGSANEELARMADCMIEHFLAWEEGRSLHHEVTMDMLERLA